MEYLSYVPHHNHLQVAANLHNNRIESNLEYIAFSEYLDNKKIVY